MSTIEKTFTTPGVGSYTGKTSEKVEKTSIISHLIKFVNTKIVLNDGTVY